MAKNKLKLIIPTFSVRIKIGDWELEASGDRYWVEKQIAKFVKLIRPKKGTENER